MWNGFNVMDYEGMIAETISLPGHDGKLVRAYWSRPITDRPTPGIVLIPHMPGWDEWFRETARRFTAHGYSVVCPNIYHDYGDGTPTEVSDRMRADGMADDKTVMGDVKGALSFLRNQANSNGRTGVIGMCTGGRHTFIAACTLENIDAAVDCWGIKHFVEEEEKTEKMPVAPSEVAKDLSCPLLGVFGDLDKHPTREEVDRLDALLKELGKDYEFIRYPNAGHAFWAYDRPNYCQQEAMDSWNRTLEFFDRHLKTT